jgi:hypothetical protein
MPELPDPVPEVDAKPAKLQIRVQNAQGPAVVRLAGEIDLSNASRLQDQLIVLVERGHVVVDLSEVTFIDSTGLSAFIVGRPPPVRACTWPAPPGRCAGCSSSPSWTGISTITMHSTERSRRPRQPTRHIPPADQQR